MSEGLGKVARGCGTSRVEGGVYVEVPLSDHGTPVEQFIMDPPVPVSKETMQAMGIRPIGISTFKDTNGTTHLVDWIGSNHYPNVADIIEEIKRHGLSRRISSAFDFGAITGESKILLMHARGHIDNYQEYNASTRVIDFPYECVKDLAAHDAGEDMCAGLWWRDIDPATMETDPNGVGRREMPWGGYRSLLRPDGVTPQYQPAFIMGLPVVRLAVVNGAGHPETVGKAAAAGVPVLETDY